MLPTATKEQKETVAKKYQIGYSKKADRLIMPIRDEFGNITKTPSLLWVKTGI